MKCVNCGCTEDAACVDERTGEVCRWIVPGVCSFCADQPATFESAMRLADAMDAAEAPMVQLFTDAQASAYLRFRSAGA
jgi:hypothetical protein